MTAAQCLPGIRVARRLRVMHRARCIYRASDHAERSSERCLEDLERTQAVLSRFTSGVLCSEVLVMVRKGSARASPKRCFQTTSKLPRGRKLQSKWILCDTVKRERVQGSQYVMLLPSHHPIRALCTMQTSNLTQISSEYCSPSGRVALLQEHSIRRKTLVARRPFIKAPLWQTRFRVTTRPQKVPSVSAQQTQTATSTAQKAEDVYQVSLKTSEARKSIRFTQTKDGRIVIEAVAIGSEAQQVCHPTGLSDSVAQEGEAISGSKGAQLTQRPPAGGYQARPAAAEHL